MSNRRDLAHVLANPSSGLTAADPALRRIAVAAAATEPSHVEKLTEMMSTDPDPPVRRECAEALGRSETNPLAAITAALSDDVATVREAAATALGEIADPSSLDVLVATAEDEDEDKLVREAAVAALGAVGDHRALPTLLALVDSGPPQIRRRCVPALTVFDGDEVEEALRRAAGDRNPMVREAAEMVVGKAAE